MARRYDSRTTIFSPEGRLYQVEYAMEAISHAGTCVGIEANDGVVLVAECRNTNKLLDNDVFNDKIYKIADHICCAVAGITADANVLTNEMRYIAQRYELNYGEPIPVEQLVSHLCDIKQAYTQYGGKRPFGVSILYMGWDKHKKFQLYQSDPSGNCSGWTATCIGSNFGAAIAMLKSELDKKKLSLLETELLGIKVLGKSFDSATITAEKVEMATLSLEVDHAGNQTTKIKILKRGEVAELVKEVLAQASQESETRS